MAKAAARTKSNSNGNARHCESAVWISDNIFRNFDEKN